MKKLWLLPEIVWNVEEGLVIRGGGAPTSSTTGP